MSGLAGVGDVIERRELWRRDAWSGLSSHALAGALAALFAASVAGTMAWCASMSAMEGTPMPGGWTLSMIWTPMSGESWASAAAAFVGMWMTMTVAMMLPSIAPTLWRHHRSVRMTAASRAGASTTLVGAGYFAVWMALGMAVYAVGATLALMETREAAVSRIVPLVAAATIVIAGGLQLTSWKTRYLSRCRHTARSAPPPRRDAWPHGVRFGAQCIMSCAGPMLVLLAAGVMDLRAMALVSAAITAERLAPAGQRVARVTGAAAIAAGLLLLARATAA